MTVGECCEVCGNFVEGFEYQHCCTERDCGCFSQPLEPCICSVCEQLSWEKIIA